MANGISKTKGHKYIEVIEKGESGQGNQHKSLVEKRHSDGAYILHYGYELKPKNGRISAEFVYLCNRFFGLTNRLHLPEKVANGVLAGMFCVNLASQRCSLEVNNTREVTDIYIDLQNGMVELKMEIVSNTEDAGRKLKGRVIPIEGGECIDQICEMLGQEELSLSELSTLWRQILQISETERYLSEGQIVAEANQHLAELISALTVLEDGSQASELVLPGVKREDLWDFNDADIAEDAARGAEKLRDLVNKLDQVQQSGDSESPLCLPIDDERMVYTERENSNHLEQWLAEFSARQQARESFSIANMPDTYTQAKGVEATRTTQSALRDRSGKSGRQIEDLVLLLEKQQAQLEKIELVLSTFRDKDSDQAPSDNSSHAKRLFEKYQRWLIMSQFRRLSRAMLAFRRWKHWQNSTSNPAIWTFQTVSKTTSAVETFGVVK